MNPPPPTIADAARLSSGHPARPLVKRLSGAPTPACEEGGDEACAAHAIDRVEAEIQASSDVPHASSGANVSSASGDNSAANPDVMPTSANDGGATAPAQPAPAPHPRAEAQQEVPVMLWFSLMPAPFLSGLWRSRASSADNTDAQTAPPPPPPPPAPPAILAFAEFFGSDIVLEDPSAPLPDGAPPVPTRADYSAAGVPDAANFSDDDLLSLADVLATENVNGAAVATSAQVQAVVASWQRIRAEADGTRLDLSPANPEASDLARVGARMGSTTSFPLLVQLLGLQNPEAVTRVTGLNALSDLVERLMAVAANRQPTTALSLEDLLAFGLRGLAPGNTRDLDNLRQAIANSADDGRDVNSLAELQALVPQAPQSFSALQQRAPGAVQVLQSPGHANEGEGFGNFARAGFDLNGDGLADVLTAGISYPGAAYDVTWFDPLSAGGVSTPVPMFGRAVVDFSARTALGEEPGREWLVWDHYGQLLLARHEGSAIGENITVEHIATLPRQYFTRELMDGSGDFNGDGLLDVVVGANDGLYLVYGTAQPRANPLSPLDLQAGIGGVQLSNIMVDNASFVGDLNGDGLDDIAVYRWTYSSPGLVNEVVTVVLGSRQPSSAPIDLDRPGERGYLIQINRTMYYVLSAAGDVNGDGFDDLFLSSQSPSFMFDVSGSFVIFGSASTADVETRQGQPTRDGHDAGFRIAIPDMSGIDGDLGSSALPVGDVNGDGLDDLSVSAESVNNFAGGLVVVFGRSQTDVVYAPGILNGGPGGVAVTGDGRWRADSWGMQVGPAGDVDGDGLQDLVATSLYSLTNEGTVVIQADADPSWIALDILGGDDADRLVGAWGSDRIAGGQGNDTLVGGGGSDVLYGGAGDDRFELNASNAQALRTAQGGPDDVMRVNGGTGIDTVALVGNGLAGAGMLGDGLLLDLRQVPDNRLQSLERWDLSDPGAQTLVMGLSDLLQSGRRALWDTGLLQAVQWMVEGGSEDTVQLHGEWSAAGHYEDAGSSYTRYHHTGTVAELLVGPGVRVELMG